MTLVEQAREIAHEVEPDMLCEGSKHTPLCKTLTKGIKVGMRAALQIAIDRGFDNDDAYNALRRLIAELEAQVR